MVKYLMIAGHGSGDAGATGFIAKGEHRYMKEDIFPAMKKFLPKDKVNDVIFFSDYNVYSRGNIVALAKSYGSDTIVTEYHYDAGGVSYSKAGGHVIIQAGLQADALDLRLRDALKNTAGLHPHYNNGISSRDNLLNARLASNGGVNYRLLELGMCTHKANAEYLLNHVDDIAKALVEAYFGTATTKPVDTSFYRVQLGAYTNRDNAVVQLKKLQSQGYTDAFITDKK